MRRLVFSEKNALRNFIPFFLGGEQIKANDDSHEEVGNCTDHGGKNREPFAYQVAHRADAEHFSCNPFKKVFRVAHNVADVLFDLACVEIFFGSCVFVETCHDRIDFVVDVYNRLIYIDAPVAEKVLNTVDQFRYNQEKNQKEDGDDRDGSQ